MAAFLVQWPERTKRAYCTKHTLEALEYPEAPRVKVSAIAARRVSGLRLVTD
jgi:hypothetical protein